MSNLVQRTRQQQQTTSDVEPLQVTLEKQANGLGMALAGRIGTDRFIRAAVTSFRTTPALQSCSRDSILGGLFVAAQLGLEVGGPRGLAYLVPYGKDATLVLGYKGWVDLFYRAGARSVQWFLIREGDQFRMASDAIHGLTYQWVPQDLDQTRTVTGAVAQVQTATGGIVWDYMTVAQIEQRRPKSWKGTPWAAWPDEMRLKTVLRHLAKRVPASTELALAQSADETVQHRVEVPGLPAEQRTEHLPLQPAPAPPQRPTAPPPPARDEVGPEPEPSDVDPDWEARERAEAEAYLAEQAESDR